MTTTIQPPEHFPFKPGEAVYFVPSSSRWGEPLPRIGAIVLDSNKWKAHIRRADKERPQSVRLCGLAYRGYCPHCPAPAIVGPGGRLICPQCLKGAIEVPPPDELVLRWFPLDSWHTPMEMHRTLIQPAWSRGAVRQDACETIEGAYQGMLGRLGLSEPSTRSASLASDFYGWRADYHAIQRMKLYALLRDDAAFLATYQDLAQAQQIARSFIDDDLPTPPSRPISIPIARPADDSEPDGADDLTRWLGEQFRDRPR